MKRKWIMYGAALTAASLALAASSTYAAECVHPDDPHHYHKYYALLVGSDAGEDIPDGVRICLQSWYNWQDIGRIEYLRNPTRQQLNDSINWHRDNVAPSDFFLFWYSGHGTCDKQGAGDEGGQAFNRFDEGLALPLGGGNWDKILDDELAGDNRFGGIGCDKMIIFHSCYSGGMWGGNDDGDLEKLDDIAVFTTSAENQTSLSDSTFAEALINGLGWGHADSDNDLHLTIDEWYGYANGLNEGELVESYDANGDSIGKTQVAPQYYSDKGEMGGKYVAYGQHDPIPEPAAISLLALGACVPLLRRKKR